MILKVRTFLLVVLFALTVPTLSFAGSLKVVPTRLYLDANKKSTVVKIENKGEEKITVQIEPNVWTQDEKGKDAVSPTSDIVAFPMMVEVDKGAERSVRIGYGGDPSDKERTYRLLIHELPGKPSGKPALRFALTVSVPVFVQPMEMTNKLSILTVGVELGKAVVSIRNIGNCHGIIKKVSAKGVDEAGAELFNAEKAGWYVLSDSARFFAVDLPEEGCVKAKKIVINAEVEKGDPLVTEVIGSPDACKAPVVEKKGPRKPPLKDPAPKE